MIYDFYPCFLPTVCDFSIEKRELWRCNTNCLTLIWQLIILLSNPLTAYNLFISVYGLLCPARVIEFRDKCLQVGQRTSWEWSQHRIKMLLLHMDTQLINHQIHFTHPTHTRDCHRAIMKGSTYFSLKPGWKRRPKEPDMVTLHLKLSFNSSLHPINKYGLPMRNVSALCQRSPLKNDCRLNTQTDDLTSQVTW